MKLNTAIATFSRLFICMFTWVAYCHSAEIEEIVVTSTRTGDTLLQETPMSISAFSEDDLERAMVRDIRDVVAIVPGLSFSQENNAMQLYIRGVGTNNVFSGSDPSTTLHVDGVYMARPTMQLLDFVEVRSVEVLRGPQGTLYGRNSAGGTINIIPKLPGDETEFKASVEVGEYDRLRLAGYFGGPIKEGVLSADISVASDQRDGYVQQLNPALSKDDLNDINRSGVRGSIRFQARSDLEFRISADFSDTDERSVQDKPLGILPDGSSPTIPAFVSTTITADPYEVFTNFVPSLQTENWGVHGHITYDYSPNLQFKSITAYRESESIWDLDQDYTELTLFDFKTDERQWQVSQELLVNGKFGRLNFVSGLYYFKENHKQLSDGPVPGAVPGSNVTFTLNSDLDAEVFAVFIDASYQLTDRLRLTAGARYSVEEKSIIGSSFINNAFQLLAQDQSDDWNAFTPRFVIDYVLTEDILLYGSVSRGFKSGSFNFTTAFPSFNEEFIWAYEAGIKADWLDKRLRTNLSGFSYDYSDLQVSTFPAVGVVQVDNAANATVNGFEAEISARPVEQLGIGAGVSYLDATYDEFSLPLPGGIMLDVSGNQMNNAPEWMYHIVSELTLPAPVAIGGDLSLRVQYSWRDKIFYTPQNQEAMSEDSFGLLQMRAAYTSPDKKWQFELFGENLTDEVYHRFKADFSPAGITAKITEPRTFGARVIFRN